MPSTWFGRLLIFVVALVILRVFFRWNISILGSVVVTLAIYAIISMFRSKERDSETDSFRDSM